MSITEVGEGMTSYVAVAAVPDPLHYVVHVARAERDDQPVCSTTATVHRIEPLPDRPLSVCGGCLIVLRERDDGVVVGEHRGAVLLRDYVAQLHRMSVEADAEQVRASAFDRRRVRVVVEFDVSLDQVDATGVHPRSWDVATEIDLRVARTLTGMPGVVGEARTTDFRMTDPPRKG